MRALFALSSLLVSLLLAGAARAEQHGLHTPHPGQGPLVLAPRLLKLDDVKLDDEPAPVRLAAADEEKPADKPAGDEEGSESSSSLPDKEVKVGGTVVGDSVGGATGFVFKQGFYTQSDLGGFFRLGGYTIDETCGGLPCAPVGTSQLQPFIGLSAGYDLFTWLGLQASFGTGFVANAAPYGNRSQDTPRDYGITFVNAGAVISWYFLDRLALAFKPFAGAAFLTPEPDINEPFIGGNVGFGIGIRYATLLPDTFVGIDWNTTYILVPDSGGGFVPAEIGGASFPGVIAFSFAPVIKYVF